MRDLSINQIVFAILLSALGIILLLINIGVISWEIKELFVVFYPYGLFVYGIGDLVNTLLKKKQHFWWSIFILIFSLLLIMDRSGILTFQFKDGWKLCPILLIYFGVGMIFKNKKMKVSFKTDFPAEIKESSSSRRIRGLSIGDVDFKKQNWAVEQMDLYNMIGDYFIDFSKGFIPDKETPVKVRGLIGEVRMIIPEDVPVKINAAVSVGEVKVFDYAPENIRHNITYKTEDYEEAVRKLNIIVELKVGSIRIDRV